MLAQLLERGGDVALHQRLEQVDHAHAVGKAEHLANVFRRYLPRRMRDALIEQRERVAHRAFRGARDQRERRRFDLDVLLGRDAFEMLDQQRGIDAAQIEALAA